MKGTTDQEVQALVRGGESLTVEFKSDIKSLPDWVARLKKKGQITQTGERKGAIYERAR